MSDIIGALALSALFGIATTVGLWFLGGFSSAGAIFLGILMTLILGVFLNWALFRPLPKFENGKLVKDD